VLLGSYSQLCWSTEWIFPQCLRVGPCVQLLQGKLMFDNTFCIFIIFLSFMIWIGLQCCRWNVLGWRNKRNQSDESTETTTDAKLLGMKQVLIWESTTLEIQTHKNCFLAVLRTNFLLQISMYYVPVFIYMSAVVLNCVTFIPQKYDLWH